MSATKLQPQGRNTALLNKMTYYFLSQFKYDILFLISIEICESG